MNGFKYRLAAFAFSAMFTASLVSCSDSFEDFSDIKLHLDKNITLDFENGDFRFDEDNCKKIRLISLIPGQCIISTADIDEPEISFDFSFDGLSRAELEEQRDNIDVSYSIEDTDVLFVSVMDKSTDYIAGHKGIDFKNTTSIATITLPDYFDSFDINTEECDIGVENLSGQIHLVTHESITGENLSFSDSSENTLKAGGDITVSTSRNNGFCSSAEISSDKKLTYICPPPEQMSANDGLDKIKLTAPNDKLTIDLNGNTYTNSTEKGYQYLVGGTIAIEPSYGNIEGNFYITNGEYVSAERSIPKTTSTVKTTAASSKKSKATTSKAVSAATATTAAFDDYSDNTNVEYHFRTKKQLEQHFQKHGDEFREDFGYKTAKEYEKGASDVINNSAALHKTEKEDGDGVYYIESTNEFVILSTDGYIRTYFRPSSGRKYYDKQ